MIAKQLDLFTKVNRISHRNKYWDILDIWTNYLEDTDFDVLEDIMAKVNYEYSNATCYPEYKNIFKVFSKSPHNIKVVILGQDPYYNGNATGLAFACKLHCSPSLNKIKEQLKSEYKNDVPIGNIDLLHLKEQGVFLLNTILTVRENDPLSHSYINWQQFITIVLQLINRVNKNVVYLLWGKEAQSYSKVINSKYILTYMHPAAASYNKQKWECPHFKETNVILNSLGLKQIIWL